LIVEPSTYFEAINSPEVEKWVEAMKDEMNSLNSLGTWSYVEVSDHQLRKTLPVKWVYKIKLNEVGEIERFKARLVAKGFKQIYGMGLQGGLCSSFQTYNIEIYAVCCCTPKHDGTPAIDVSTAFLHGTLEEEVFVKQPEGFHVGGPNTVCKLHKALYGLKASTSCMVHYFF
jgi:hypothetical protein